MFTDDITSEIQDLFNDFQGQFEDDLKAELTLGTATGPNAGFRAFNPNPPKTPERLAQIRKSVATIANRDILERLQAGERPKKWGKRWVAAANMLGIDVPAPTGKNTRKSWVAATANALVTCGAPGGVS